MDRRGKLIQMIQVICCSSLLSVPGRAGAFSRDFTTSLAPGCRAFSGALEIEKLKAPLNPGPEGAVDTNDWCITIFCECTARFVSALVETPEDRFSHDAAQRALAPG